MTVVWSLPFGLGPEISFGACLWVLIRPHHIATCWCPSRMLSLLLYSAQRPPRTAQVLQTFEQNRLCRDCWQFRFLVTQHTQGPNTVPRCAVVIQHVQGPNTVPLCAVVIQHVQGPNTVPLCAVVPQHVQGPIQSHCVPL